MQADLLAGTLKLDPENDPVICTTDYGLHIRWHMTGLPANSANMLSPITSGNLMVGYAYINHADVNWVIIGYSNKNATFSSGTLINLTTFLSYYSSFSDPLSFLELKDTDAATAIYNANLNQSGFLYNISSVTGKIKSALFPNAKSSSELEGNEVLCLAQGSIGYSKLYGSADTNQYYGSILRSTIIDFYNKNLTSLPIVPQPLITQHYGGTDSTNIKSDHLFPLAGASNSESFYYGKYLTSGKDGNMDINLDWWLRSGWTDTIRPYVVNYNGGVGYSYNFSVVNSLAVRPAFVLKI